MKKIPESHEIARIRLNSQRLIGNESKSPEELVSWFGAMQAQDYPMSRFAVGMRSQTESDTEIERAIDDGRIIRTHVLRPTWHLVTAEDAGWMLDLSAANIHRQMNSSSRALGLTEGVFRKSVYELESMLAEGAMTREQIYERWNASGLGTGTMRGVHMLMYAEVNKVICNGPRISGQPTYALFSARIPKSTTKDRETSLHDLALKYFKSHGPATIRDFAWWSGMSLTDCKKAIELASNELNQMKFSEELYYTVESDSVDGDSILLLPSFDEFLIAYKDRSPSIENEFTSAAFTRNGIFNPIVVVNGRVVGVWKRTVKSDKVLVDVAYFYKIAATQRQQVQNRAEQYAAFIQKKLTFKDA